MAVVSQTNQWDGLITYLPLRFPRTFRGADSMRVSPNITNGGYILQVMYRSGGLEYVPFDTPESLIEMLQTTEIARRPRESWEFHH